MLKRLTFQYVSITGHGILSQLSVSDITEQEPLLNQ